MTQFLLRDDDPRTQYSKRDPNYWSTYQTGLEFSDGRPKPAYDSYRLPFVAPASAREGSPITLWGMVRAGAPGAQQSVRLQFAPEGSSSFADMGDPITVNDARGYFQVQAKATQSGTWRFRWTPPGPPPKPTLLDRLAGRTPAPPVYTSASAPVHVSP
jgi:hypothetical protein